MDENRVKNLERVVSVVMGCILASEAMRSSGIELRDAKIAMRVGAFILDEIYRRKPGSLEVVEQMNKEISPVVLELIKAEIEAEPA